VPGTPAPFLVQIKYLRDEKDSTHMNSEQRDFSTAGLPGEPGFLDEKRLLARSPVSRRALGQLKIGRFSLFDRATQKCRIQRQKTPTRRNSETYLTAERHVERRGEI
jgi:hypothetical protein